jgi:carboxylesterase
MLRPQPADPAPFTLQGGETGILLVHGFTGSPAEMRRLGHYLHDRGLTVDAPLLPGPGTTPEDMNRRRGGGWLDCARSALGVLCTRCPTVYVAGLSMGTLLALCLAAEDARVAGLVLYAPAVGLMDKRTHFVPVLRYLLRTVPKPPDYFVDPEAAAHLWSYPVYPVAAAHELIHLIRATRRRLPQIACPALIVESSGDRDVRPESGQIVLKQIASQDKQLVTLHNSGHVITIDKEWEQVAELTYAFIRQRAAMRQRA